VRAGCGESVADEHELYRRAYLRLRATKTSQEIAHRGRRLSEGVLVRESGLIASRAASMSREAVVRTDGPAVRSFEHLAMIDAALLIVEKQAVIEITSFLVLQSILLIVLRRHLLHEMTDQIFCRKCRRSMRH
jgi:hypothetical protein